MASPTASAAQAPVLPLHMRRERFDPPAEIAAIREQPGPGRVATPIGRPAWLVTRYEDAREVLGDATRFSSAGLPVIPVPGADPGQQRAGNLLMLAPPGNSRLRRPPAAVVPDFALPVPSLVICELLGVPYEDRAEFHRRAAKQLDLTRPIEERGKVALEGRAYMSELVDRAFVEPGEDMLGMLVREHGDDLTHDELVGVASLLLIAGHETTANMLAIGTLALLRHPEQAALVRDDPAATAPAVEELMRFLSVVHTGVPRVATTDTEVAGQAVGEGDVLVVSLPAADRDRALVEDPALLRRFPTLAPAIPFEDVDFRSASVVYGLRSLPVTW